MTLQEYKQLAPNTMKEMDYKDQQIHLVLGISGEFLSEVAPVLSGGIINKTELTEELGDMMWYVGCYANINDMFLRAYPTPPIDSVGKIIGDLLENSKKEWVYGKEFKTVDKEKYIQQIVFWVNHICNQFDIELSDVLSLNIEKLQKRFPNKFEADKAINKNTVAEQEIFNGTDTKTEEATSESSEGAGEK
jgi:NTP pyrophosphatase (non-canonical NTP hydrolase)